MSPIPCSHCGNNFMRHTIDPEAPKLCNSCDLREKTRTKGNKMETQTVGILIQAPKETQIEIEEYCINQGIDFSKYFLILHENFKSQLAEIQKNIEKKSEETEESPEKDWSDTVTHTNPKTKNKGNKK